MSQETRFLTKLKLAQRWDKSPRTIDRYDTNPPIGFPGTVMIAGRKHWNLEEIEAYERSLISVKRKQE